MGSDQWKNRTLPRRFRFQFTLPHGERPKTRRAQNRATKFQFTLPHGERPRRRRRGRRRSCFNSRSRMGSDEGPRTDRTPADGFNSRSRMGSDLPGLPTPRLAGVSIHAPAWGATARTCADCGREFVSIHAPAWGATRVGRHDTKMGSVSIHAPAWGATRKEPRPPRGKEFQFTLPHGERLGGRPHRRHQGRFNSRSRMGSDAALEPRRDGEGVSIHAPAWGATRPPSSEAGRRGVSIHAPAWGATCAPRLQGRSSAGFNSRSRMGSDLTRAPPRAR